MVEDSGRALREPALVSDQAPLGLDPSGFDPARGYPLGYPCPFDGRLARTPYLVLPKLAIQVMPMEWRVRFDAMLEEMEAVGLETPAYEVVLEGGEIRQKRCRDKEDWRYGDIIPVASIDDPWADYRHCQIEKVRALCPRFRDSDGSPKGRDAKRLDGEAATARAEGIAHPLPGS